MWSVWAAPPTPNTRRRMIEHHGTCAWYTAASARAPWRIVEACSAAVPITKPGWSTRCTTGRWNVSASSTKASIFCDESAVRPPPKNIESDASTATGQPSRRASPVTTDRPQPRPISKNVSWSTTASMIGRMA